MHKSSASRLASAKVRCWFRLQHLTPPNCAADTCIFWRTNVLRQKAPEYVDSRNRLLLRIDGLVAWYALRRLDHSRLARECAKLMTDENQDRCEDERSGTPIACALASQELRAGFPLTMEPESIRDLLARNLDVRTLGQRMAHSAGSIDSRKRTSRAADSSGSLSGDTNVLTNRRRKHC